MNDSRRNRNRLIVLSGIFFVIYCVTVVPVGLFLYNLKSDAGWNVFKKGGYHTYLRCLAVSAELADMPVKPVVAPVR